MYFAFADEEEQRESTNQNNTLGVSDPYCSRLQNRCSVTSLQGPTNSQNRTAESGGSRYTLHT